MSITASHSISVEYNIPQDKGESPLRLVADDFAGQGRPVASKSEPATVGVGQREDPVPEVA